eukprot:3608906-Prymnesium_polylepis.1
MRWPPWPLGRAGCASSGNPRTRAASRPEIQPHHEGGLVRPPRRWPPSNWLCLSRRALTSAPY